MIFIINPKSGGKSNSFIKEEILKVFPEAEIVFTERAAHATEIAKNTTHTHVIAVGGDGTINEVSSALIGTNKIFGIIPRGSGNGFAREIGASLDAKKAILQLKTAKEVLCDTGQINGDYFINLAGVGIEAEIAHAFAVHGKRGMWPYFKIGAKKVFTYKPKNLRVTFDGQTKEISPLTLVFANGRQYGSNFLIAPEASLTDNMLDMIEMPNKNFFSLLLGLPSFFSLSIRPFNPCITTKIKEARVESNGPLVYHIDGEPKVSEGPLEIKIIPNALKVLMP